MGLNLLSVLITLYLVTNALALSCSELKKGYEELCLKASQKQNYVQCVTTRMKRHQQDCQYDSECSECRCDICSYNQCGGQCDGCCYSCCPNYVRCHTSHCCHKQCNSECRSSNCRSSCRKSCYNTVQQEKELIDRDRVIQAPIVIGSNGPSVQTADNKNEIKSNASTTIHISNYVNATSAVDIPVNLTCANENNLILHENKDISKKDGCCIVIGPRQCMTMPMGSQTKCFHTRSRQCGSYCTASIVHEENRQICTSVDNFGRPANCQQQKTYIPQPQPKCFYTSTWPYISCGVQPPVECEGCYAHDFNNQKQFKSCPSQCYDSFGVGPLYRQGPFYQGSYSQVPPCMYSPQGCMGVMSGYGSYQGLGAVGNEFGQGFGGGFGVGSNLPSYFPMQNMIPPLGGFNLTENTNFTSLYHQINGQSPGSNREMEIAVAISDPYDTPAAKRSVRPGQGLNKNKSYSIVKV